MRYTHECECDEPTCNREMAIELLADGIYLVGIADRNDRHYAACIMTAADLAAWLEESDGELIVNGPDEYNIIADIDAVRVGVLIMQK